MKKGVKILIICMALVIVGLITFIVVDKVINKDKNNEIVANATINNTNSNVNTTAEENQVKENNATNSTGSEKKEEKKSDDSNTAAKKIAEALKERRFLAKNGIDDVQSSKFMKVGNNLYLIQIDYKTSEGVYLTAYFMVRYEDNGVVFDKIEGDKHPYDLFIDKENKIIKAERIMKGYVSTKIYDISGGEFKVKETFGAPYIEGDVDYSDMYKYTVNDEEVEKDTYESKLNKYNNGFVSFEDEAVLFNDNNIDSMVK